MLITSMAGSYNHDVHGYILAGLGNDSLPYRWDEESAQWILLNQYAWDSQNWTVGIIG